MVQSQSTFLKFIEISTHVLLGNKGSNSVINNVKIPISDSTKFLGVYIDKELRWTMHVNNLHKKLMANKFLLSVNTNLLDSTCLRSIYYSHVFTHLSYGLLVWGLMASKKAIKDLTHIQDHCVHLLS